MNVTAIGAASVGTAPGAAEADLAPVRPNASLAVEPSHGGFGTLLGQMMSDAVGVVKTAEAASLAGIKGQMPVQQVVDAVMAGEQTLQAAIAVRDKVVAAYLEISRMSI
jgi:flagellar hook-basal body complex protein FliE